MPTRNPFAAIASTCDVLRQRRAGSSLPTDSASGTLRQEPPRRFPSRRRVDLVRARFVKRRHVLVLRLEGNRRPGEVRFRQRCFHPAQLCRRPPAIRPRSDRHALPSEIRPGPTANHCTATRTAGTDLPQRLLRARTLRRRLSGSNRSVRSH